MIELTSKRISSPVIFDQSYYKTFKNNLAFKKGAINHLYDIHSEPLNFFYTRDSIKNMLDSALQKYEQ